MHLSVSRVAWNPMLKHCLSWTRSTHSLEISNKKATSIWRKWQKSLQGRCTTATTGKNDAGVAPVGRQPQGPPNGCQDSQHRSYDALYPQLKPVPIYIAWWTEAHVCEQLAQSCTWQRISRESNSQPLDHESDALTLHHQATQVDNYVRFFQKLW